MKKILYIISFLFICFLSFTMNVNAEIIYDVTSLTIDDNILKLEGWGLIHDRHNGRYINNDFKWGYANLYTFKLISNGNVIDSKSVQYYDHLASNGSISATCLLRSESKSGENSKCLENFTSGKLSNRDAMITGDNYFYDMIDFFVSFDISNIPKGTYYISMEITAGFKGESGTDVYKESIDKLHIVPMNIHNNSSNFKVLPDTGTVGTVKMLARNARLQTFSAMDIGSLSLLVSNNCKFINGNDYQVLDKDTLNNKFSLAGNKTIYKYKLRGDYTGCGSASTLDAGAYSFWVQASGETQIVIEREEEIKDPCLGKDYAYNNPGVCCTYYPETCCGGTNLSSPNTNFIVDGYKNWTDGDAILNFCCSNETYLQYGTATIKLPTFKYYGLTSNKCNNSCTNSDDYYEGSICCISGNSGILTGNALSAYNSNITKCTPNICTSSSEYYNGSDCCNSGKNNTLTGEALKTYNNNKSKCNEIKINKCTLNNNNCTDSTYFNNNIACCCGLYGDTSPFLSKCKDAPTTWKPSGLSCNSSPSTSTIVASGETTNGSFKTSEKVAFTNYKTLTNMQKEENIIKSGTGFGYEITATHTVEKKYTGTSGTNSYPLDYSAYEYDQARQYALNYYNSNISPLITSLPLITDIKNTLNNKPFKFNSQGNIEDYQLKSDPTASSVEYMPGVLYFKYKVCTPHYVDNTWITICNYDQIGYISVNLSSVREYYYTLELKDKYIAKLDGTVTTNVSTSDKPNYLEGGNKYYTKTTTETGVYDFNVTINNGGVTGNLKTTANGFSCQYGVINKHNKYFCDLEGCPGNEKTGGRGFYFRQISLSDPFPNREPGLNWKKYYDNTNNIYQYITHSGSNDSYGSTNDEKGNKVYQKEPMYEVTLDSDLINQIKRYNRDNNFDYSWINMASSNFDYLDSTSNFLSGVGTLSCESDRGSNKCDFINWKNKLNITTNRSDKVGDFN